MKIRNRNKHLHFRKRNVIGAADKIGVLENEIEVSKYVSKSIIFRIN
jgi:hypothetical protein